MTLPPFQLLVDAHWHDVARLAAALAPPGEAQDVSQQAWTQAYAAYPRLRGADNLRSWLLTITHRAAMDAHRARAIRPDPVTELPEPALAPATSAAADSSASADSDPALWAAVAALPVRQREAVALRYVCDLDHATVAAVLATTPGATRRLVSDGLATLRRALAPTSTDLAPSTAHSPAHSPADSPADPPAEDRS